MKEQVVPISPLHSSLSLFPCGSSYSHLTPYLLTVIIVIYFSRLALRLAAVFYRVTVGDHR